MIDKMKIGKRIFKLNLDIGDTIIPYPYVMGILNVTPDSFSDGGSYTDTDKALRHTEEMLDYGADIIDVGGESTRPGHIKISDAEEIERTCFVIEAIKEHFDVPVSLDTYKSKVAEAGLLAGADMINDIWGLKWDDRMAALIAKHDVPCCIMHNRNMNGPYKNYPQDVVYDLQESLDIAAGAGIRQENIMLDPGIGFAKTTDENLIMMNNLELIADMGYPVLLGTSRKSMIGSTLDLPVSEREEGTLATSVIGLMKGVNFFRVHDVRANVRALRMTHAVMQKGI